VTPVPAEVLAAWGWGPELELTRLTGGLINATFAVHQDGAPIAVVQRLHPVFGPSVNLDLEAVTRHLAARGLETPLLVRTTAGAAWHLEAPPAGPGEAAGAGTRGRVWRALTWVDGVSVATVPDLRWAAAGGELVGRFHRAVRDLDHRYHFTRAGVHDTAAHLARLRERVASAPEPDEPTARQLVGEARELGATILAAAAALPPLPDTPRRHCHGDLKIANLMFRGDGAAPRATSLVDLDTLGLGTLAFELGDAMRSWCNPPGEDVAAARFELATFAAAMGAWRDVAGHLATAEEQASVVAGLETVCVELAARFCVDVFDDSYFGWDPERFASRRAHDLRRAQGQLALAASVREQREEARAVMLGGA
jgi:Ser/Thr protein kinase RdoA (MazF antagonist)